MARRPLLTVVITTVVFLLLCCAAYAQEQTPTQPVEGEDTQGSGSIYLYLDDEPVPVQRDIAGGNQMIEFALLELFKGPTEEETAAGYVTYIPAGVKLQYTTVKQDRSEFSVNLSRELLELSGDADSSAKALTQIVKTAQDVSGIENIGVTVAGEALGDPPQDAFEALGVEKGKTGTEGTDSGSSQDGGKGWVVLGIVLGALAVILAAVAVVYLLRKRKPAKDKAQSKKTAGKKPGKKKAAK
jgi:hypothetical protein